MKKLALLFTVVVLLTALVSCSVGGGTTTTTETSTSSSDGDQPHEHIWDDHYTVDVYPTADREGTVSIHCSVDGCTETKQVTAFPYSEECAADHSFDDGTRVVVPGSYSYTVYACQNCDAVMVVVDEELTPAE